MQFVLANLRADRKNLYMVLFDYVLHQINGECLASGVSEYSDDESQVIATLLTLADAPEALHISVKLGVEGVGDLLKTSVAAALSRYANCDRLCMVIWSCNHLLFKSQKMLPFDLCTCQTVKIKICYLYVIYQFSQNNKVCRA